MSFADKRKETIKNKNDFIIDSLKITDSIEEYSKRKEEIEEGVSRIPTDLPPELQGSVNDAITYTKDCLDDERKDLLAKSDSIIEKGDITLDDTRALSDNLHDKSKRMKAQSGIPIIGKFFDQKGDELNNQAEQISDLVEEILEYDDKIRIERNKLMESIK